MKVTKLSFLFHVFVILMLLLLLFGIVPAWAQVVINEVDCDTPSTDTLEFVELYDGGAGNTALDGLVVVFYNGGDDASYKAFDLDGYSTDGNGYFLLGNSGVSPTPSITFSDNGLQNGADAVAIYVGDAAAFPNDTPVTTTNLLDAIVYDTNDTDDAGLLVLLNTGQPQVNEDGAGDKDNHSNQRCPNGSGGARNTDTYIQATPTPGADNNCPPPVATNIIINEVDCDTPSTDTLEFVELYDGGAGNTALDGLVVAFYNGGDDASYDAFDLDGYSTDGNGYFLLGNSGVTPTPSITFGNGSLQNGADAVAIYVGDAADFPNGTLVTITNLLDAIVYDTNDADDAGLLVLLNAGQPQANEGGAGHSDAHSNQRCPNGSGGQRNTSNYTQNTPTPGGANNCANNPPTADAGPPQIVEVGDLVQLDASSSNDPDLGDTLSYSWSFTSKPSGSGAILSDPTAVNPTFTADEPGYYDLDLTVEDGHGGMDSDRVIVLAVYFLAPSPRNVVINEVAWMGTTYRFQDEWMELKNNTDLPIDLTGWQLVSGDIYPSILLSGTIPPHSYFLLERTDDDPVSDIAADQVFIGVLNNPDAQQLFLLDPSYRVIDTANGDGGPWPAGTTVPIGRYTMERIDPLEPDSDANWGTNDGITQNGTNAGGNPIHGTPKAHNSATNFPPIAGFIFSPTEPTTQQAVQFTDQSTDPDGTVTSWSWTFGDGTTSALQNSIHQYANGGTYTVILEVTDDDGATGSISQQVTVKNVGPSAGFAFAPVHPLTDESVQFTDLSSDVDGTITSWTWDFGDAGSSSAQNPTHTYAMGGIYTVRLTVTDDGNASNTTEKQIEVINCIDFINLGPNPVTSNGCVFWLCLPDDTFDATLKIFDIDGALLRSIPLDPTTDRYPAAGRWIPQDDTGRLLGTGLYLYLVEIEHTDGTTTYSKVQKMVIKR